MIGLKVNTLKGLSAMPRGAVSGTTSLPTVTMPSGKSRIKVTCDLPDAHQLDPNKILTVAVEISTDGGANWRLHSGFTTKGNADRDTQAGWPNETQPFQESWPPPPTGCLVRTQITSGAQAVDTGARVELN